MSTMYNFVHFRSSTTLSSTAPTEASTDDVEDHINVVTRIRPLNTQEINRKDTFTFTFPGAGRCEIDNASSTRQFAFNVVFEPDATQEDLFIHSGVKRLIDMALSGYACTALAFGQTGSGKTHTMTGPPQQFEGGKHPEPEMLGIIQRSFEYMFQQIGQIGGSHVIKASYLEIYNEQVIDLLNPNQRRYLAVRWSKNKGFYVENLFLVECETVDDLMAVLEEGMRNRQTGSHGLNETSSRSHSMLTLTIDSEIQDPEDENLYLTKRGKLTFVDLAGSEKVKESNSSAETLIESNNINRSLLVLGNCISSLGDAKKRQGHIPYRDSKLTKLLADSLGGQGVTLMIACVTPSSHHAAESINTLRYASRAKRIRTKPIVKMDPREKLIMSLKREVKALRNENVYLRQQLEFPAKTARPVGTQRENEEKINKIMKEKETHKNNVDPQVPKGNTDEAGLYEMLQEYMIENEALRTENSEMHSNKDKVKREQQNLYKENERLLRRIEDLQREKRAIERRSNPPPQDPYYTSPHQSPIPMGYGRPPPPQGNVQQWSNQPVQYPADQYSGYNSPNAGNRGKPPPHGVPKRPPHRLPPDPIMRQGHPPPQELIQNGIYNDEGYMSPNGRQPYQNGNRQESPQKVDSRRSSYSSSSDNIRNMNEKLKQELMQLDGEIEQSQVVNYRTRSLYGSQASLRSGPR